MNVDWSTLLLIRNIVHIKYSSWEQLRRIVQIVFLVPVQCIVLDTSTWSSISQYRWEERPWRGQRAPRHPHSKPNVSQLWKVCRTCSRRTQLMWDRSDLKTVPELQPTRLGCRVFWRYLRRYLSWRWNLPPRCSRRYLKSLHRPYLGAD